MGIYTSKMHGNHWNYKGKEIGILGEAGKAMREDSKNIDKYILKRI